MGSLRANSYDEPQLTQTIIALVHLKGIIGSSIVFFAINLIAKINCLDVINWPNHLRVIKVIKFTKAKFQYNSQTEFKSKKKYYR